MKSFRSLGIPFSELYGLEWLPVDATHALIYSAGQSVN